MIMTIGVLFLIPGLISVLGYFFRNKQSSKKTFPIDSIGGVLLGLALIVAPTFFVRILMYVLAGLLIFAGIMQLHSLFIVRKRIRIPVAFYLVSVLILLTGIVILFNPFDAPKIAFIILGIACVIYGVSELVNYLKFLRK